MTHIFWLSLVYTSFWVVMILVTKISTRAFQIKTSSFRNYAALFLQNGMTALGWFVLILIPKTYLLAACINTACHVFQDLFFVKSYQKQSARILLTNTAFSWMFWPQYIGFNIFSTVHSKEFSSHLEDVVDKSRRDPPDE